MSTGSSNAAPFRNPKGFRMEPGVKLRGADKLARIPVKVIPTAKEDMPRKPDWLRVRMGSSAEVTRIKDKLRNHRLSSVCEEASCPNIGECFSAGTATFMIMGDICTRRCPFCDVATGKPRALDQGEPQELAEVIADLALRYVVITSVDRDDLRDSGAQHFANCVSEIRKRMESIQIETLVPDFRGCLDNALDIISTSLPDVLNHNMETVPALYRKVRPVADYQGSLNLLKRFKERHPDIRTKSGLMVGLGETNEEILEVMRDLRAHDVDMLTIGQYLQPSRDHLKVERWVTPVEFDEFRRAAEEMGFKHAACGPLVRSSYHADLQAQGELIK